MNSVTVVGAGLAGCEAAWALARRGAAVTLREMKPEKYSPAHSSPDFAELVCSNSLKASRLSSAAGLLKEEMRLLGSLTMACASRTAVEAGGALAVDRALFSRAVTEAIRSRPEITVETGEVTEIPSGPVILATGPLTSDALAEKIAALCGGRRLSFFDASAPIVSAESVDRDKVFSASRYGDGGPDGGYLNCPFNREQYEAFQTELVGAGTAELRGFEKDFFRVYEGCMPIEVLAKRGGDAIRFGPLKPVGLRDPRTGHRPWANVQLRREDAAASLYNLVGFQTNLLFPEQKRVFSMIPGLEHAEFMRYGVMHRNTYIDSPRLLDATFRMRERPDVFFAGQITGVEGYTESAASGILAGVAASRALRGLPTPPPPRETMLGALCAYISDPAVEDFQPMGANMGILPPLEDRPRGREERYAALSARAAALMKDYAQEVMV